MRFAFLAPVLLSASLLGATAYADNGQSSSADPNAGAVATAPQLTRMARDDRGHHHHGHGHGHGHGHHHHHHHRR